MDDIRTMTRRFVISKRTRDFGGFMKSRVFDILILKQDKHLESGCFFLQLMTLRLFD
jgi:hypothetical protein